MRLINTLIKKSDLIRYLQTAKLPLGTLRKNGMPFKKFDFPNPVVKTTGKTLWRMDDVIRWAALVRGF